VSAQHFTIRHRFTNAVLFEGQFNTMRLCVQAARQARADLSWADLSWANLSAADLSRADLSRADLSAATLSRADLSRADLSRANLSGADLWRANLSRADLSWANLSGADLSWADLSGANLSAANLSAANLSGATWRDSIVLRRRGIAKDASRSDGHRFLLLDTKQGWRVQAGCRFFTLPQAWQHWEAARAGTDLGDETFDILVMFEHHAERVDARPVAS
jgi:hypothetical protein